MEASQSLLIIDEDRLLGELVKAAIESDRLRVAVATSSAIARRAVEASNPDLILINPAIAGADQLLEDWRVPGTTGPLVAIVDSDQKRRMAKAAGLETVDRKDGLSDLVHIVRTRLNLESLPGGDGDQMLVVDDEAESRELLANFLTGIGYSVSTARDGVEAMEQCEGNPSLQIVLLDIQMPRQGGITTLVEIQKRRNPPGVIITTGISDQEIAHHALELGAFDFIVKPLDLVRLESTVSACLSHRRYRGKSLWKRLVG